MLEYPQQIDARIAQAVAIVTFVTSYTIIVVPNLDWIIYILTIDFLLRYLHPKFSPIVRFFGLTSQFLQLQKKFKFAPPKRFATLIGLLLTSLISLFTLTGLVVFQYFFISLILIASFLQGFLDFCIGCEVYNWMIKIGVINNFLVFNDAMKS